MEHPMPDSVTYNQIITLKKNNSIKCQIVKKSFTEKGKLILILEDLQKIIIDGKNIVISGYKERIFEMVSMAEEEGFDVSMKSVKHYARIENSEFVVVKW